MVISKKQAVQSLIGAFIIYVSGALFVAATILLLINGMRSENVTSLLLLALSILTGNFGFQLVADAVTNAKLNSIAQRLEAMERQFLPDDDADP